MCIHMIYLLRIFQKISDFFSILIMFFSWVFRSHQPIKSYVCIIRVGNFQAGWRKSLENIKRVEPRTFCIPSECSINWATWTIHVGNPLAITPDQLNWINFRKRWTCAWAFTQYPKYPGFDSGLNTSSLSLEISNSYDFIFNQFHWYKNCRCLKISFKLLHGYIIIIIIQHRNNLIIFKKI